MENYLSIIRISKKIVSKVTNSKTIYIALYGKSIYVSSQHQAEDITDLRSEQQALNLNKLQKNGSCLAYSNIEDGVAMFPLH